MKKGVAIVLLTLLVAAARRPEPVVLTGTATDCEHGDVIKIPLMEVRALDPSAHQDLVGLLRTMDTVTWAGDGTEAMSRFEPMYEQMLDLLTSSTPLARDTTTEVGMFNLFVPSSDSVLVIAQAPIEDVPIYYAYAMLSARSNVAFELDMSRGNCRVPGTIQRTGAGLIFQDDFNRPNGAPGTDWEIQGNSAFWSIAGNVLKAKPTDATLQQILVANNVFGPARGEMVVQARMRRVGTVRTVFPGIQARHDAVGGSWFRWMVTNSTSATQDEFHRTLAGVATILSTSPSYASNPLWQQFKLAVHDGQQRGWKGTMLAVNLTNTDLNAVAGRAGLSTGWSTVTSAYHEFDDFAVYKGNTVTINGLPAGYKLRIGTRVAVESGGTATLDLLEDLCPRGNAEVLDANGLVVAQLAPSGGVWGGDTYRYTP